MNPSFTSHKLISFFLVPLVFGMHIAFRLYLLFSLPVSVDAAFNFSHFTSKGFQTAVSYYPVPNNHVLHTILTLFVYDPGPYQTYLLRIPAFLFGLASLWLFYKITKAKFGLVSASVALAVFGAIQPVLMYGYQARGYSMILFFSLAAVYFWTRDQDFPRKWHAVFYILCLTLGLYTIPSQLYFIFAFSVGIGLLHIGRKSSVPVMLRLVAFNLIGFALAVACYLPIIKSQGVDALIGNRFVEAQESLGMTEWFEHFQEVGEYYLLLQAGIFAVALLSVLILARRNNASSIGIISAGVCLSILIIPFLHRTLPFLRVWIFATPFFIWAVAEVVIVLRKKNFEIPQVLKLALVASAVLASFFWQRHSTKNIEAGEKGAIHYKRLSDRLIEQRALKLYINDFYAYAFMPYHFEHSEVADEAQLSIAGDTDIGADKWRQLCQDYDVMVVSSSFANDSLAGSCMVDTSWANVLVNAKSCECINGKLAARTSN